VDNEWQRMKNGEEKQIQKFKNSENIAILLLALVVGYFFIGIIGGIVGLLIALYIVNKYR